MRYEEESILDDYLAYSLIVRTTPENTRKIVEFIKSLPETRLIRDRISTDDLYIVTKDELINGYICKAKGWKQRDSEEE